jgi:hypothetical protein
MNENFKYFAKNYLKQVSAEEISTAVGPVNLKMKCGEKQSSKAAQNRHSISHCRSCFCWRGLSSYLRASCQAPQQVSCTSVYSICTA